VARVLVVGCGCRGRELVAELRSRGHSVRGTTRSGSHLPELLAADADAVIADPNRLATLTPHLDGVSVLCWLMGSAQGDPEKVAALHGPRLETLMWKLVDTHVRGAVYEAAGTVAPELRDQGGAIVRRMRETFNMPTEAVDQDPGDHAAWLEAMTAAVDRVLSV
jgi:hypothetical protein